MRSFLLRKDGLALIARSMAARIPIFARAFLLQVLLDQHQDVIDVDFGLLGQLDLGYHIVVDRLLVRIRRIAEFGVEIQIQALVILGLALAEDFVSIIDIRPHHTRDAVTQEVLRK